MEISTYTLVPYKIISRFYHNRDNLSGHTYEKVMKNDFDWESSHNFIQYLFPTDQKSQFNPTAPVLTLEDINVLSYNSLFIFRLNNAWVEFHERYISEYGSEFHLFCSGPNHNHLRLTRILRCLRLFKQPRNIFSNIVLLKENGKLKCTKESWNYWLEEMKNN